MPDPDDPVDRFIAQPAVHYDEDVERPIEHIAPAHRVGWRARVMRFLFDKEPSRYSSIAPRTPDGRRTKLFFFNGNGRSR